MDSLCEALLARTRPVASFDPLDDVLERIGAARVVLIGEASHGTSEYYSTRARLSRRLIAEKGFSFVAVEGDWPDCYEVNRYVKSAPDTADSARATLQGFNRWPTWMWANWEVATFADWLRTHNRRRPEKERVGFYGLDLYSLWESLEAVLTHVREHHPEAVRATQQALACLQPYEREPHNYARTLRYVPDGCDDEIVEVLTRLRQTPLRYPDDPEAHFDAEQNALAAVGAETYYRTMVRNDELSWNVRDIHMTETLERLLAHHGRGAKAIVWEHNTHIGDARATDMAKAGMVNVGSLARARFGLENCFALGFGGYSGTVMAGAYWGAPAEVLEVPPARDASWESLFHAAAPEDRLAFTDDLGDIGEFHERRGHRAIGVVYDPARERHGNYVPTDLIGRYDAWITYERTRAVHPLRTNEQDAHEPPETYPFGF